MRTLVCFPMKSLAKTYMPTECESLVAESAEEYFRLAKLYQPGAAVLFSEMFDEPVWEWLPRVQEVLPEGVPVIIVPLYKDESLIAKVKEETDPAGLYILPATLNQEEIREKIALILGVSQKSEELPTAKGDGIVYTLMSYGSSGITTFCINYPILLAKRNPDKRIVVLDMNAQKPDLTRFFKLQQHHLALFRPDLLEMRTAAARNWERGCKQISHIPNLYYASATCSWKSGEISNLLTALRQQFDYVYIDWGYCFPETEALQRLIYASDRNLFFVRADPFGIENAKAWIHAWAERGVEYQVMLSHLDKGQTYRIGEGISVYGVVPRISDTRLIQSHRSHSVLVEEIFPPKPYVTSLQAMVDAVHADKGAVVCR
jgi:cellulose biosynthesis protein BcsQ